MTVRAATEEQVADLAAQVAKMRAQLEELRRELAPDLVRLADLLAAVHSELPGRVFTAAELVEYALERGEPRLQAALASIIGPTAGAGVDRLARFLVKRRGRQAGGLVLSHVRRGREGHEYVVTVTETARPAASVTPPVASSHRAR